MNGNMLRDAFNLLVPAKAIESHARSLDVIRRQRKLELATLVWALVLASGSDDSGRQADAYSTYLDEADQPVVRGSFYAWFTERLERLMKALTARALAQVRKTVPHLPGGLSTVSDRILVDSETVSLRDAFAVEFPSTSTRPGLKVHKFFSLGRNNIVDFKISAARDHDAPFLRVDESWRGRGLIVDLGYASLKLLRDCQEHGVMLIIRLKSGWKPLLLGVADADGRVVPSHDEWVMEGLVDLGPDELDGQTIDMDVRCGRGANSVDMRLVGVPGSEICYWCLTTLPRDTHPLSKVCTLYRCRWEVELDMKRDKSGVASTRSAPRRGRRS